MDKEVAYGKTMSPNITLIPLLKVQPGGQKLETSKASLMGVCRSFSILLEGLRKKHFQGPSAVIISF